LQFLAPLHPRTLALKNDQSSALALKNDHAPTSHNSATLYASCPTRSSKIASSASVHCTRSGVKESWESFPAGAILLFQMIIFSGNSTHTTTASQQTASQRSAQKPPPADLWRVLLQRRSIRRYTAAPVARAEIETILHAASWAPSSHNRQPWRFCVVTDTQKRDHLADTMAEAWRVDLRADGTLTPAEIDKRIALRRARLKGAPVVIVPCLAMQGMDVYPDAHRATAEWTMGVQSVALACQNLLLAAHALGLGACWMCAALFVPEIIRGELNLPQDWHPQALITIGYPAETRSSERAPLMEKVLWR